MLTVLAVTANLLVLPEHTRSLLTRTVRAELPAAHLTPAEYVAVLICHGAVFMLVCLAVHTAVAAACPPWPRPRPSTRCACGPARSSTGR